MIDGHIHLEHQPYTLETIDLMVDCAIKAGVTECYILDHTHKFIEFNPIYTPLLDHPAIDAWFHHQEQISVETYLTFIKQVKQNKYPIPLHFGLEVCYIPETEATIRSLLEQYPVDFTIGSIHYVDHFPFDLDKHLWEGIDVNRLYRRYYEVMEQCIQSKLFPILGHPDSIKLFQIIPSIDLTSHYHRIAKLLHETGMETENNSGLWRYGFPYPGLDPVFLAILKEHQVSIHRSSDAHRAIDIGRYFDLIDEQI